MQGFLAKHQITQVTQALCSPDLVPCDFWLFQKLKSPLKGKRFQTFSEIQEKTTEQMTAIRRTVWGPKVPNLKETEASLPYVQCFLHLVSSLINVSIFHIAWLDTFWTTIIYLKDSGNIKQKNMDFEYKQYCYCFNHTFLVRPWSYYLSSLKIDWDKLWIVIRDNNM